MLAVVLISYISLLALLYAFFCLDGSVSAPYSLFRSRALRT